MKPGLKFAAIDIGSNAVRLLLSSVFETDHGPYFKKISLIRMPIRLGEDAFIHQRIGEDKINRLVWTMTGFKHLMAAYGPVAHRACATSAMREARNSDDICQRVADETGIEIQVIDGSEEAQIIFANGNGKVHAAGKAMVYLDVGGGSTEITILDDGQRASRSFNIGTIRLMEDMVPSAEWDHLKRWVQSRTCDLDKPEAFGSGGNIHKIVRLSKHKQTESISFKQMKKVRKLLKAYTVDERITQLGLKPDRADVILPAHKIYYSVMKWGGIPVIRVPQMGLADGLVRQLHSDYVNSGSLPQTN